MDGSLQRLETPGNSDGGSTPDANVFILRGNIELEPTPDGLAAHFVLKSGESVVFTFSFSAEAPAVVPPLGSAIDEKLNLAIDWWRSWAAQSTYRGPYQRQVTRSALVLKLLSYAPSGTIIAAPTTSLPECIGGGLNWDYRFAWLRDASFTVHALFGLGYKDDAAAFVDWLLHATRLTRPKLRVVYDVFGESPPPERVLSHFGRTPQSRPVRVGNAASEQMQLDVYGELVEAVSHFFGKTEKLDRDVHGMLRGIGEYVCEHWREYDNGIWEERDELRPYTHSRLMCWVALDRLLQMHARGQVRRLDAARCAAERENIRKEIEAACLEPAACRLHASLRQRHHGRDSAAFSVPRFRVGRFSTDAGNLRPRFGNDSCRAAVSFTATSKAKIGMKARLPFAVSGKWIFWRVAEKRRKRTKSSRPRSVTLTTSIFSRKRSSRTQAKRWEIFHRLSRIWVSSMPRWRYVTEQKRRVSIRPMNWSSWLLWGFVATVVLTTLLAGSQGLGMTRMNVPYLLGTIVTPNRDRAKLIGVLLHFINGWLFSLIYVAAFQLIGRSTWWFGGLIGLVQGSFVLAVALPALPALHPRMANEQYGPTVARQLEPPGFLGLHYGIRTPISVLVAHTIFGVILGAFYVVK